MDNQHLTYFKIENFKRFDSFEMENLGQFNLIVGDNNVGKTSVLEALTFDEDLINWRGNLHLAVAYRGFYGDKSILQSSDLREAEIWNLFFKDPKKSILVSSKSNHDITLSLSLVTFNDLNTNEIDIIKQKLISPVPPLWLKEELSNSTALQLQPAYFENESTLLATNYFPFISNNLSYGDDLVDFFYEHINTNKKLKKELESNLHILIPNLEELRVHRFSKSHEILCVVLKNSDNIFPLTRFGDGSVKVTRMLLEILVSRGKRLMVDEMGSGVHFTRLPNYWKMIIQLCAKYDVQLFTTTHSLECQQAFIEALEDSEMQQYQKDARNISLIENKQGAVEAITFDFEQFEYALNIGFNTRGGKA